MREVAFGKSLVGYEIEPTIYLSFIMNLDDDKRISPIPNNKKDNWYNLKAGLFLTSITGCSVLAGFGLTLGMAKRTDQRHFAKGLIGSKEIPESGVALATRALARASLYTVSGFGLFCFAVWKMMGVHNMVEFREKVGNALPRLKRKESTGRNEFATIRDLFQYIIDEDEKSKAAKVEKEQQSVNNTTS